MRSLFDRISEPQSMDFATQKEIQEGDIKSIELEINSLLNTRSYFSGKQKGSVRTILDYGLDDIVSAGSQISGKLENVILNVRAAIKNYEPRLTNVVVTGEYHDSNPRQLLIHISAKLLNTQVPIKYKIPLTIPILEA